MRSFLVPTLSNLVPYTPGEQPSQSYIKLNTNENPFPPSPKAQEIVNKEALQTLNLYPDPLARSLKNELANYHNLQAENIMVANGSDEVLAIAFMAFANKEKPILFPDITYGFYQVHADLFGLTTKIIPLNEDFTVPLQPFLNNEGMVVIANPNAPTSLQLPLLAIEEILKNNPDNVVLIDEAYVDFATESVIPLLKKYDNLLIVRTFSKSRSLAGARVGYALGSKMLISNLETVRNSFHPYNINRLSLAIAVASVQDDNYFKQCCTKLIACREECAKKLREMNFKVLNSATNFLFVSPPSISGETYFTELRSRGILTRHWNNKRICNYVRITIGTQEDMQKVLVATKEILEAISI